VWLTVPAFVALQLLAVCHSGDKIPGRSTWGSPTMSTHPWTPGGTKGARGLLTVPYRSPVVSIVPACPPDGSPEDQFDPRRRMDNMCTARVFMQNKECTVRSGWARESAASQASPGDAPPPRQRVELCPKRPTCQSRGPSFTFDVQGHGGSDLHRLLA
jgi:hypothetical protein